MRWAAGVPILWLVEPWSWCLLADWNVFTASAWCYLASYMWSQQEAEAVQDEVHIAPSVPLILCFTCVLVVAAEEQSFVLSSNVPKGIWRLVYISCSNPTLFLQVPYHYIRSESQTTVIFTLLTSRMTSKQALQQYVLPLRESFIQTASQRDSWDSIRETIRPLSTEVLDEIKGSAKSWRTYLQTCAGSDAHEPLWIPVCEAARLRCLNTKTDSFKIWDQALLQLLQEQKIGEESGEIKSNPPAYSSTWVVLWREGKLRLTSQIMFLGSHLLFSNRCMSWSGWINAWLPLDICISQSLQSPCHECFSSIDDISWKIGQY